MKCILHIGTEKTGTSLLQDWFYAHRKTFIKNGIYLTTAFGKPNNRHVPAYFRVELDDFTRAHGINSKEEKAAFFASFQKDFENELASAAGCDHFLISSEHFHSRLMDPAELAALRDFLSGYFDETIVVCYFREQSDMALSFYSTQLKGGGVLELEEFLNTVRPDRYYYNHLKIADNWSNAFGVECCRFRVYERDRFEGGDIRRDFLNAIGVAAGPMEQCFGEQSSNESLSALQAAVFLKINQKLPYWDDANGGVNGVNIKLKKRLLSHGRLKGGRITHDRQAEISEQFHDVNDRFFAKYFEGDAGFAKREPKESDALEVGAEDVQAVVSDILDVLLDQYRDIEEQIADAQARRSKLAEWIDKCDYRVHRAISEASFLPKNMRERFRGAAQRRKRSIYSD